MNVTDLQNNVSAKNGRLIILSKDLITDIRRYYPDIKFNDFNGTMEWSVSPGIMCVNHGRATAELMTHSFGQYLLLRSTARR